MVVAASLADSSLGIAITGSLTTAVRLIHPVGESYVNHSEGSFLDGYMGGGPRCHECRQRDGKAAEEDEKHRVRQEAEEYNAAVAGLWKAEDPGEIAKLIRQAGERLSADDCKDAWARLVRSGELGEHDFEVVKVRLSHKKLWGNSAIEQSRLSVWRYSNSLGADKDWHLIGADGSLWSEDKGAPGISATTVLPNQFGHTTYDVVAVPQGAEVRARKRRGGHGWTIEAGRPVIQGGNLPVAMLSVIEGL